MKKRDEKFYEDRIASNVKKARRDIATADQIGSIGKIACAFISLLFSMGLGLSASADLRQAQILRDKKKLSELRNKEN